MVVVSSKMPPKDTKEEDSRHACVVTILCGKEHALMLTDEGVPWGFNLRVGGKSFLKKGGTNNTDPIRSGHPVGLVQTP